MAEKATLEQMAEACQDEADHYRGTLKHFSEFYPGVRDPQRETTVRALEGAALIMRAMSTYEDESRKFIAGLLKRHRDGR